MAENEFIYLYLDLNFRVFTIDPSHKLSFNQLENNQNDASVQSIQINSI